MSDNTNRRLPNGEYTTDANVYADAWSLLLDDVCEALGPRAEPVACNPTVVIVWDRETFVDHDGVEKVRGGTDIHLPISMAERIIEMGKKDD
jgi:hypothetical protein